MKEYFDEKNGQEKKLLLYVHGGLNHFKHTLERLKNVEEIKENGYYPIFIGWDTGPINCYGEQLFFIRDGKREPFLGFLTFPFQLFSDLGYGISRSPIYWWRIIQNAWDSGKLDISLKTSELKDADAFAKIVYKKYEESKKTEDESEKNFDVLKYSRDDEINYDIAGASFIRAAFWVATIPIKIVLTPVLSGIGQSAWDNMRRRSVICFHPEDQINLGSTRKQLAAVEDIYDGGNKENHLIMIDENGDELPSDEYKVIIKNKKIIKVIKLSNNQELSPAEFQKIKFKSEINLENGNTGALMQFMKAISKVTAPNRKRKVQNSIPEELDQNKLKIEIGKLKNNWLQTKLKNKTTICE